MPLPYVPVPSRPVSILVVAPMFKSKAWRNLRMQGKVAAMREKCMITWVVMTVFVESNVGSIEEELRLMKRRRMEVGIVTL